MRTIQKIWITLLLTFFSLGSSYASWTIDNSTSFNIWWHITSCTDNSWLNWVDTNLYPLLFSKKLWVSILCWNYFNWTIAGIDYWNFTNNSTNWILGGCTWTWLTTPYGFGNFIDYYVPVDNDFFTIYSSSEMDLVCWANTVTPTSSSVDYVAGVSTIGESQYSNFLGLINSPIGWLLALVLWIKLLKWMWFELKSFTPNKKD